jgi:hypothetical protein
MWPASSLPSSTGMMLFEISALEGNLGSDPRALFDGPLGRREVARGAWPDLGGSEETRGPCRFELRTAAPPLPRTAERAATSLEQTHWHEDPGSVGILGYFERQMESRPGGRCGEISWKPAASGERSAGFHRRTGGFHQPNHLGGLAVEAREGLAPGNGHGGVSLLIDCASHRPRFQVLAAGGICFDELEHVGEAAQPVLVAAGEKPSLSKHRAAIGPKPGSPVAGE